MNTPDTEVRVRALEYEVQTLRTLLTALQGRVAELSASAPSAQQSKPLQLFLVLRTDQFDPQEAAGIGYYKEFVVCCADAETARLTSPFWWGFEQFVTMKGSDILLDSRGQYVYCRWAKNIRDVAVRHLGEAAIEIPQGIVSIAYVPVR